LTSSHTRRRLIPLANKPSLLLLTNNLLLMLDQRAAVAESAEQAVGDAVAFDVVGLADFLAFHECEEPREMAAVCAEPQEAVIVDLLVGCQ